MTPAKAELAERFAAYDRRLATLRAVAEAMQRSWPDLKDAPHAEPRPARDAEPEAPARSAP